MLGWQKNHHGTIKAQGAADTLPTPGAQSSVWEGGAFSSLGGLPAGKLVQRFCVPHPCWFSQGCGFSLFR
jgi:hypothetical protein